MATRSPSPFLLDPATVVELGLRSSSSTTQYYEWEATPAPITTRPNNHLQAATVVELGLRSSSPTTQYYEWETTPAPTTTRPNNSYTNVFQIAVYLVFGRSASACG